MCSLVGQPLAYERLDVGIVTANLDPMLRFYCEVLGLDRVADRSYASGTRIVVVQAGPVQLKLNLPSPAPSAVAPAGTHRAATGIRYLTLHLADAAGAHAELTRRGADVDPTLRDSPAGVLFFVRDPDGNHIEIVQVAQPSGAKREREEK